MQAQTVKSFDLVNHEKSGIEQYKTYGFLDQSYFDYPESWTLRGNFVKSIEKMRAYLYRGIDRDEDGKLSDPKGQIRIQLVSKLLETSLTDEIKKFRETLEYPGYSLGELIDTREYNYHGDIVKGRAEIYELEPQEATMQPYELVVSVAEGQDYYYLVSMLTPSRGLEYYEWARNMEAFRIVIESIRRTYLMDDDDYYQQMIEEIDYENLSPEERKLLGLEE